MLVHRHSIPPVSKQQRKSEQTAQPPSIAVAENTQKVKRITFKMNNQAKMMSEYVLNTKQKLL